MGACGEMVIKRELVRRGYHQKGAGGEVVIKREQVGQWSSKRS